MAAVRAAGAAEQRPSGSREVHGRTAAECRALCCPISSARRTPPRGRGAEATRADEGQPSVSKGARVAAERRAAHFPPHNAPRAHCACMCLRLQARAARARYGESSDRGKEPPAEPLALPTLKFPKTQSPVLFHIAGSKSPMPSYISSSSSARSSASSFGVPSTSWVRADSNEDPHEVGERGWEKHVRDGGGGRPRL